MPATIRGIPASPGIVVGPAHLLRWEVPDVAPRTIDDLEVPGEIARFRAALHTAVERLRSIRERAEQHAGVAEARIFDVQISIIDDETLRGQVEAVVGFIEDAGSYTGTLVERDYAGIPRVVGARRRRDGTWTAS